MPPEALAQGCFTGTRQLLQLVQQTNTPQMIRKFFTVALASIALATPASAFSDAEMNAMINEMIDAQFAATSTPGLLRSRYAPGGFVGQLEGGAEIFITVMGKDSDGDYNVNTLEASGSERSFYVSCSRDQIAEHGATKWRQVNHNTAEGYIADAACLN